jgi:hypothetical protein
MKTMKTRIQNSWITSSGQIVLGCVVTGFLLAPSTQASVVAEWNLNGNANDLSGSGNHGTLQGGASFVSDANGGGVEMNGTGDFIDFGNSPIWNNVSTPFSVEAWFVIDNTGNKPILGVTEPTPVFGLETGNASGGLKGFQLYPGYDAFPNNPSNGRDLSVLRHLVGTYDGSTAILYEDAAVGPDGALATTTAPVTSTNPLRAGADHAGNGAYDGRIYHLRIWDNALTSGEVGTLFAAGPDNTIVPEPSTIALWALGFGALVGCRRRR